MRGLARSRPPRAHAIFPPRSKFTVDKCAEPSRPARLAADAVGRRYTLNKVVGTGAYGVVISVDDAVSGRALAIKKIPNAFDDLTDSKVPHPPPFFD